MPDIRTIRVGPIWIAFEMNDWSEFGEPRFGWTEAHARRRVVARLT